MPVDERRAELIAQRFALPLPVARIIASRGIPVDDVANFINPKLQNLMPDPFCMKDMEKAAKRIAEAIVKKQKVAIIGDYDVDGATSSSVLRLYLESVGIEPEIHIPERDEGYGPSRQAFDEFAALGAELVITVDCGTTAFDVFDYAGSLNIPVIVLDHHEAEVRLPEVYAVVNPKRLDESDDYPYLKYMAAVGVVFCTIVAVNRELRKLKIKVMTCKTLRDLQVSDGVVHAVAATSPFVDVPAAKRTEEPIEADMVLVTVGRKSTADSLGLEKAGVATDKRGWITVDQHLMTNVPGIYAIGDILGPSHVMLAHVASMEGLCALDNILGKERAMDYSVIPSAIFTSPEIGEVGMSEAQAKESCQKVVTGTVQMRELGKAHAMGELPGFFKVIADAESGLLLGLHVAGAHASDLVAEGGIAMEKKATIYDLAATIHAHPTLAEGIYEAARLAVRAAEKLN